MTSKLAGLVTLLGGGLWLIDEPKPVVHVNEQSSFMSAWPSEAIGSSSGLPPECAFWNQSVIFSDEMCSLFVVNRAAAAYPSASARAMRCTAALAPSACSAQIAAMFAAFLHNHATSSMRCSSHPPLPHESTQQHVRVSPPDLTASRRRARTCSTRLCGRGLDGQSKAWVDLEFVGRPTASSCWARLEPTCWKALD